MKESFVGKRMKFSESLTLGSREFLTDYKEEFLAGPSITEKKSPLSSINSAKTNIILPPPLVTTKKSDFFTFTKPLVTEETFSHFSHISKFIFF